MNNLEQSGTYGGFSYQDASISTGKEINVKEIFGEEYKNIAKDEIAMLEVIKPVVASDKRLGYHSEAHAYMFNEEMIETKIKTLKSQISKN
jgi:hypothetical protein